MSFCYFWALDMAPTYAAPGLFNTSRIFDVISEVKHLRRLETSRLNEAATIEYVYICVCYVRVTRTKSCWTCFLAGCWADSWKCPASPAMLDPPREQTECCWYHQLKHYTNYQLMKTKTATTTTTMNLGVTKNLEIVTECFLFHQPKCQKLTLDEPFSSFDVNSTIFNSI